MLLGITSPQGAGKTTLINALREQGYNIIDRQVSRSILTDWNVTLDEVNSDLELSKKFQEEILTRKIKDDTAALLSYKKVWISERTPIDLAVMALYNFGNKNKYNEWYEDYFNRCQESVNKYDGIVYIKGGHWPVKADGVRGTNQHYVDSVNLLMWHFFEKMTKNIKTKVLHGADMKGRIENIDWMVSGIQNA